jgi:hypothetical protein
MTEKILSLVQIRIVDNRLEQQVRVELVDGDERIEVEEWRPVGFVSTLAENLSREIKRYGRIADRISKIKWEEIDWARSNTNIAIDLGIKGKYVAQQRELLGKPCHDRRGQWKKGAAKVTEEMLQSTDWANERDIDLARKWGVTRERVRQIRVAKKAPSPSQFPMGDVRVRSTMKWLAENKEALNGKYIGDIVKQMPPDIRGRSRRMELVKAAGIEAVYNGDKKEWSGVEVNWDIPNAWLSTIYDRKSFFFGVLRYNRMARKAKWRMSGFGMGNVRDKSFREAIRAEIEKAKAAGLKVNEQAVLNKINETEIAYDQILAKKAATHASTAASHAPHDG